MPSTRRPRTVYAAGQRYRHYTLIERVPNHVDRNGNPQVAWKCLCDCGKEFITSSHQITKRIRNSCGCRNQTQPVDDKTFITNCRFGHYRNGAKGRNLSWELTYDQFAILLFGDCAYCGSPPRLSVTIGKHTHLANGVDRVDNSKGYGIGNVVPCCWSCNAAKSSGTVEELKIWMKRLIAYNGYTK